MARVKIGHVYPPDDYLLQRCAPAGFGLGESVGKDSAANEINKNGFYVCDTDMPDTFWWYGFHIQFSSDYAYQEFCSCNGVDQRICRYKTAGIWQPWEWITYPLYAGSEYRTTEKYRGETVYIKLVDCAGMPSANSIKTVEHGINKLWHIVDFGGSMMPDHANAVALPFRYSNENYAHLCVDFQKIQLESGTTDLTANNNVYVWIKYTKTKD